MDFIDIKNFLPGPTMVRPELLAQLSQPIIGHRTPEFRQLMAQINPRLQRLFGAQNPVFCFTCTASAAMEAALLNAGGGKILILANGLFGERWGQAALKLGLDSAILDAGWGKPFSPGEIERRLGQEGFSSLVLVHGETSTGMLNPVEPLSAILSGRDDVLLIVDAVATIGGVALRMDQAGIDVLVGALQKCLALPPGIVPIGVSQKALERSRASRRKGYAGDFSLWQERWKECEVVATPALPQLYALNYQLAQIEAETLPARWERHQRMLNMTSDWAKRHGWRTFAPQDFLLPSVSCLLPPLGEDTTPWVAALRDRGYLIDGGYGRLNGQVLRIGHMGDWREKDLAGLLQALAEIVPQRF